MVLYHGTKTDNNKNSIVKYGFRMSNEEDGIVGSGVYATDNYELAYTYTEEENKPYKRSGNRIIRFDINENKIMKLLYKDAAKISGIQTAQCNWNVSVDKLNNIKDYVINKGYSGV